MKRRSVAVALVTLAMLAFTPDIDACGDKSLAPGGIRWQRAMAARYPASVLAYIPPTSRLPAASRELKLPEKLREVGHTYHEVSTLAELHASVGTGQFNIVVADVTQVAEVQSTLRSTSPRVVVIPIAYKLTKAEARELAKQSRFVIKVPSRAVQYLNTVAEAVRSRTETSRQS